MRVVLILILAGITSFEVFQAVVAAKKWNSYQSKILVEKNPCPSNEQIIQIVEHNPINDINIDSFMQVYGFTQENMHSSPVRKKLKKKSEILIEPKKIVPEPPKFKIKINKDN